VKASLRVPLITVILGEAGSGGALAIGMANRVGMLSKAYYTVISPEGAASILGRYLSIHFFAFHLHRYILSLFLSGFFHFR
jgi:acetyl-CoA carboxylase carboxyltransferase component